MKCVLANIVLFDESCDTAVDYTHMHVQQFTCESRMQWVNKCLRLFIVCLEK